jgi:hypothetical protein
MAEQNTERITPLATIYDVDPDLKSVARQVPASTLSALNPAELTARCLGAQRLYDEADHSGEEKARRLRRQARRILRAMTPRAFRLAMEVLEEEIRQARLDQASYRVMRAGDQMRELERLHPQPGPEAVMAVIQPLVDQITGNKKLTIPPPPSGHSWMRRRQGRKR